MARRAGGGVAPARFVSDGEGCGVADVEDTMRHRTRATTHVAPSDVDPRDVEVEMRRSTLLVTALILASALLLATPAAALAANGNFAFIRGGDLWMMKADGTGQKRVAHTTTVESCPAWSRDRKMVAFARTTRSGTPVASIWTVKATGKNIAKLVFAEPMKGFKRTVVDSISWAPNGARVAVADRVSKGTTFYSRIIIVTRKTKKATVLYRQPGDFTDGYVVSWNRDGKRLLVNSMPTDVSNGGLMAINVSAKKRTSIKGPGGWAASYSPDGAKIAAVRVTSSSTGITYRLVVMKANGSNPQVLFTTTGSTSSFYSSLPIAWSGDGKKLAYSLATGLQTPTFATWTLTIATKATAKIADDAMAPAWQR